MFVVLWVVSGSTRRRFTVSGYEQQKPAPGEYRFLREQIYSVKYCLESKAISVTDRGGP
jgi:hypothetical protein